MKLKGIILIISILILLLSSSCSLLIDGYTRNVAYNSICWEDNDHILVYANIEAYDDYTTIGGGARNYIWIGGEIWRINVNTGEKELLMRKRESEYYQQIEAINIIKTDDNYFVSGTFNTYQLREDFNGWDSIGNYVHPIYSDNENIVVAAYISNEYEDQIRRYDLIGNTYENIYTPSSLVKNLDYDYERNLLLINNTRLINLNTGMDTVFVEFGDSLQEYRVTSASARNSIINDSLIIFDVQLGDTWSKIYMDIDNFENISIRKGFMGQLSPDGSKGAHGHSHSVDIFSINGILLRTIEFPEDEI